MNIYVYIYIYIYPTTPAAGPDTASTMMLWAKWNLRT